jgi:hypothetical protein
VPHFQVRELACRGVGGEVGEPVAVDVGEPQLGAGVTTVFLAAGDALAPAGTNLVQAGNSASLPGKRNRGVPSGTSDLRKPVAVALVFRLNDGSVTVANVASFTARYPARVADELGALQTAPGYDVTSLGMPTSSSLAALSGK